MDIARLNTSSATSGHIPHAGSYSASRGSMRSRTSSDTVSISPEARDHSARLRVASSSGTPVQGVRPLTSMSGMPPENIALYNQIRRERDSLPPSDPRIKELSDSLQTILMAGTTPLSEADVSITPARPARGTAPATPQPPVADAAAADTTAQQHSLSAPATNFSPTDGREAVSVIPPSYRAADDSASKNQHTDRLLAATPTASGTLPTSPLRDAEAAAATSELATEASRPAASASRTRIHAYRAMSSVGDQAVSLSGFGRLHRVA